MRIIPLIAGLILMLSAGPILWAGEIVTSSSGDSGGARLIRRSEDGLIRRSTGLIIAEAGSSVSIGGGGGGSSRGGGGGGGAAGGTGSGAASAEAASGRQPAAGSLGAAEPAGTNTIRSGSSAIHASGGGEASGGTGTGTAMTPGTPTDAAPSGDEDAGDASKEPVASYHGDALDVQEENESASLAANEESRPGQPGDLYVRDYGALGDGVTDDTAAISRAIREAAAGQTVWLSGSHLVSGYLPTPASGVTIRGSGQDTTLVLSADSRAFGQTGSPLFYLAGVDSVAIRDLTIDGQGDQRPDSAALSTIITLSNASHCLIENVRFVDCGMDPATGTRASGPIICLVAKAEAGDKRNYLGEVGPVTHNTIRGCRFEVTGSPRYQFAIRMLTDWEAGRSREAFGENVCAYNVVEDCSFEGAWEWNTIEIAGPGTIHNRVARSTVTGRALANFDIDKGASDNTIEDCTVVSGGIPAFYQDKPNVRLAAFAVSGTREHQAAGNVIRNCQATDIASHEDYTFAYQSGCSVQYADMTTIEGLTVDGLTQGGEVSHGAAILVDREVFDLTVSGLKTRRTRHGITTNANLKSLGAVHLSDVDVESVSTGINFFSTTTEAIEMVVISNARIASGHGLGNGIYLGRVQQAEVENVAIDGFLNGVRADDVESLSLSANRIANCRRYGVYVGMAGNLTTADLEFANNAVDFAGPGRRR